MRVVGKGRVVLLLWESLVDRAVGEARQEQGQRRAVSAVVSTLDELIDDDGEEVQRAWTYCMERYAREEDLAWLRAAGYLLLLDFHLEGEYQR